MFYRAVILAVVFSIISPLQISRAEDESYNLSRTISPVSPERFIIYEAIIVPWLQEEFTKSAWVDDGAMIKRHLVKTNLLRFEDIEGQERYNVHIEYRVFIRDPSGVELKGIKGQEIVFWVQDDRMMDFFPFDEYWIDAIVVQEKDYF